ncbi:MAG: cytochrome c [Bacteroidetes bacterium]|nr:cytochrome c [Bacteroidota bacterium]
MKTQMLTKTFLMASAIVLVYSLPGCGGSGNKTEDTSGKTEVKPEAKPEASASEDGIGRFAGKEVAAFDAAKATVGKTIFENKCSACHKTTEDKVVGPGLKGVTERRKAQWILNMITNPVEMTKSDPIGQALLAEHLTQMTNQDISDDDAIALLQYLRQNDGAK